MDKLTRYSFADDEGAYEYCTSSDVEKLEAELAGLRAKLEATREQAHEKADISLRTFTLDQLTDESGEPQFTWPTEFVLKDEVDAELTRLRGEVERLTKAMDTAMCVYCRTVTPKDPDEMAKHILGCKKHPINLIIELEQSIIAERKAIAEAVMDITNEHPRDRVTACNNLADRIEKGEVKP